MNEVTIGNMPTLPYAVEEAVNRLRINIVCNDAALASDGRIRNTVDPVRCRPS